LYFLYVSNDIQSSIWDQIHSMQKHRMQNDLSRPLTQSLDEQKYTGTCVV